MARDGYWVKSEKKFKILKELLENKPPKKIAYKEKVSLGSVYDVKKSFPLFFWKGVQKP